MRPSFYKERVSVLLHISILELFPFRKVASTANIFHPNGFRIQLSNNISIRRNMVIRRVRHNLEFARKTLYFSKYKPDISGP